LLKKVNLFGLMKLRMILKHGTKMNQITGKVEKIALLETIDRLLFGMTHFVNNLIPSCAKESSLNMSK
jgi:predicted phosphodiesterase